MAPKVLEEASLMGRVLAFMSHELSGFIKPGMMWVENNKPGTLGMKHGLEP